MIPLYVATDAVLAHYGINQAQVSTSSDILSSRTDLRGLQIFVPVFKPGPTRDGPGGSPGVTHPVIQSFTQLPKYTSDPGVLVTAKAMRTLGLEAIPSGWLIQADHRLTADQISTARQAAASAGLFIETRHAPNTLAPLRNWSTTAGILLALGVLAMTVGLIRSETANDLRTLTATGASSTTRRNVTAATAGALALLGAVLGAAGAYAALLAWHRSDLSPLANVPVGNLIVILVGLPLIASVGGWLLAGREPPTINRKPLE